MSDDVKMQRIAGHSEERFLGSDVFESSGRSLPPPLKGGTVREDAREIDIYHRCDIVVVGGGPAGCALANRLSARADNRILLVEAGPDAPPDATPEDIAATCAFLCSDDAGYITGQQIGVNGGWYL